MELVGCLSVVDGFPVEAVVQWALSPSAQQAELELVCECRLAEDTSEAAADIQQELTDNIQHAAGAPHHLEK